MKKNVSIIMVLLTISFLFGCDSSGNKFNYQNRMNLELGVTSTNDAIKLVGKPEETKTVSNNDGNYETLIYEYTFTGLGGTEARVLYLEFKDDKLNAYIYNSGFEEDKTDFAFSKSTNLKVGQSSKNDVEQLLGEPSGKAICPSTFTLKDYPTLRDYPAKCQNATEIWSWIYSQKIPGTAHESTLKKLIKTKSIYISFDEKGIMVDMETSQERYLF